MNIVITGMSGAVIEHSTVITNFVAIVYSQLKNNLCRVYPDNVQYKWVVDGEEKKVIPDAEKVTGGLQEKIACEKDKRKVRCVFE